MAKIFDIGTKSELPEYGHEYSDSTVVPPSETPDIEPKEVKGKATPEALYRLEDVDRASKIVSVVEKLNKALDNVRTAIRDFDDEIEREIQLDYLRNNVFELILLKDINQNFGDILTAIQVCLKNESNSPFSQLQLVKMEKVLQIMKNNFNMSDNVFENCLNILDEDFDLAIPMGIQSKDA